MTNSIEETTLSNIKRLKNTIQTELMLQNGSKLLSWLNDCCLELTSICRYIHENLTNDQSSKTVKVSIDTIFLSLRQLITCVSNLEHIASIEMKEDVTLNICRQHFQERMIHCLSRLSASITNSSAVDQSFSNSETNFVVYMDQALQILAPLVLNLTLGENKENHVTEIEFFKSSKKIRETIELLLGQVLAFTCVVSKSDRLALNTLSHRVMKDCIDFQECCFYDQTESDDDDKKYTENDKRLRAQQLQNGLYSLDRLMNESFLRVFFSAFSDYLENPLKPIQLLEQNRCQSKSVLLDEIIEKFDEILDQLIQIGNFGIAYSMNSKAKSNLQSCLASFEAISISLVPSILSGAFEYDTKYLENLWTETIRDFRRSIQEIINSHALCLVIIDLMHHMLHESNESNGNYQIYLKSIINHCEILLEHIQLNATELNLLDDAQLKIHFDDFKMMLNECKAGLKAINSIDATRIKKRFNILISLIKKMCKAIAIIENNRKDETVDDGEHFTFGHVTAPDDIDKTQNEPLYGSLSDSMNVIVDLNEFIEKNDVVKRELTHRSEIFYKRPSISRKLPKFSIAGEEPEPKSTFRRNTSNTKRCSKRTSLRVAMFKRQKMLDTKKFIADSMSQSSQYQGGDSLNLQITDILDQLSRYTIDSETT